MFQFLYYCHYRLIEYSYLFEFLYIMIVFVLLLLIHADFFVLKMAVLQYFKVLQ